jgi:hypothetical protein
MSDFDCLYNTNLKKKYMLICLKERGSVYNQFLFYRLQGVKIAKKNPTKFD